MMIAEQIKCASLDHQHQIVQRKAVPWMKIWGVAPSRRSSLRRSNMTGPSYATNNPFWDTKQILKIMHFNPFHLAVN